MKLSNLLAEISFYVKAIPASLQEEILIKDIKSNHKEVGKGDLFICLKGEKFDGHQFARDAERRGAVLIFSEKDLDLSIPTVILTSTKDALAKIAAYFYNHPARELQLFGITGTNGKTTVSYLLNQIFSLYGKRTGIIGTIGTKIQDEKFASDYTTPDALSLQRTLKEMAKKQVELSFIEVSSHALALGRVHGCEFDLVIFTNLSQDHLDFHGSMENYAFSKSLLFSQLGSSYSKEKKKYVILNKDDQLAGFLKKSTAQHVFTYSHKEKADIWARNISVTNKQSHFTMVTPRGEINISSPLLGRFNIANMLASASAAFIKGVPLGVIKKAFETIKPIPGRFEILPTKKDYTVIVDYAHTPDSLKKVLQTAKSFTRGRLILVLGCGGNRDELKRPLMGRVALTYADWAIFTSDNPRYEDPEVIIKQMIKGLTSTNYHVEINRKKAIHFAIQRARKNDTILIAGKGHESYQEIRGVKYDFDDRLIALQAIKHKEK